MSEVLSHIKLEDYESADLEQFYTEIEIGGETILVPFIRQSERRAFKTCQYQWSWAWNQGFTPALPKQDARWFGTGLHLALAEWYVAGKKRGADMHKTWDKFCGDNYTKIATGPYFDPDEWVDAKTLGHEMITNYLLEYDTDSDWEVVSVEQRYRMKLKDADDNVIGILVGTFDAVWRNIKTGQIWMVDHKTERDRISTNHLVKDEQAGTYVAVATMVLRAQGLIGKDEVVRGIIYNFLRKAKADTRPRNHRGVYCNKPTSKHYLEAITNYLNNLWDNPQTTEEMRDMIQVEYGGTGNGEFPLLKKLKAGELPPVAEALGLEVFGDESERQPAPLFKREPVERNAYERTRQLERIKEELEQMRMIRTGQLSLTKSPGDHCAWCDFRDLCEVDEAGGDAADYARAAFRQRDPYADHRPNAINSKTSVANDTEAKSKIRAF